jgi:hypothetical protein
MRRREKQMYVIGHQAIGVQSAAHLAAQLMKAGQVNQAVVLMDETILAVVAAA